MAAPRASSFKVLRNLQRVSNSTPAKRSLHMTGVREAPQQIETGHKTIYTSWGFQDLRNECQKRTLTATGNKHELVDRLAAHDSLQHRAFSMALRRIAKDQQKKNISGWVHSPRSYAEGANIHNVQSPTDSITFRTFNTSRSHNAVAVSSTMDFVYFPKLFEGSFVPEPATIRVPILPHVESDVAEAVLEKFPELDAAAGAYQDTDSGANVMKAEISSADSQSGAASPMSDVHDGNLPQEMSVEMLTKLTETVSDSARQIANAMKNKDESTARKLWNGLLDDLFGSKGAKA